MPEGPFQSSIIGFQGRIPGYHHNVIPRKEEVHMQTTEFPQPAPHPVSDHGFSHPFPNGKTETAYLPVIGEKVDYQIFICIGLPFAIHPCKIISPPETVLLLHQTTPFHHKEIGVRRQLSAAQPLPRPLNPNSWLGEDINKKTGTGLPYLVMRSNVSCPSDVFF